MVRRLGSGVEAASGGTQVEAVKCMRLLLFSRLESKVAQARVGSKGGGSGWSKEDLGVDTLTVDSEKERSGPEWDRRWRGER